MFCTTESKSITFNTGLFLEDFYSQRLKSQICFIYLSGFVFNLTSAGKDSLQRISFPGGVSPACGKFTLLEPELLFLPYMGEVLLGFLQNHLHLSYSQGKRLTYEVVLLLCYLMCEQSIYLFHLLHGFLIF